MYTQFSFKMSVDYHVLLLVVSGTLMVLGMESRNLDFPPDFIREHRCRRHDPEIEKCMLKALKDLRPYLKSGIPELHIPALEPFYIPELTLPQRRGGRMKASVTELRAYGGSDFTMQFKMGVERLTSNIYIEIPELDFEFEYDVDMKIAGVPIRGFGTVRGNLTAIKADAISRAHLEPKQDGNHIKFDKMDVKLGLVDFSFSVVNQYKGNTVLTNDTVRAINANSRQLIKNALPYANKIISAMMPEYMNKVTENFLYEDLFIDD